MGKTKIQDNRKDQTGEIRPNITRHPALIVLKALLLGLPIELDGITYQVADYYYPDGREAERLCWLATLNGETRILLSDMSVDTLVSLSKKLGEDELVIIGANIVLNTINK
jgi:hypothetical protein